MGYRKTNFGIRNQITASVPGFHQIGRGMRAMPNRGQRPCMVVKLTTSLNVASPLLLHNTEFTHPPVTILAEIHHSLHLILSIKKPHFYNQHYLGRLQIILISQSQRRQVTKNLGLVLQMLNWDWQCKTCYVGLTSTL